MHRDGFMGVFGSCNIRPLTQMTQLALILLQIPSRQLTCASTEGEKKMTTEILKIKKNQISLMDLILNFFSDFKKILKPKSQL